MNENTYCIIMAGGLGSRFWPMSHLDRPKQFIDLMGTGSTMLQSTFSRMEKICPRENIIIVTSGSMEEMVIRQIPHLKKYQVLTEPMRRNTAPCVAYAASIIYKKNPNANIVVTPSDHAIFQEDKYIDDINKAINITSKNDWIITIGARPTSPNSKYGYIQFDESKPLSTDVPLYPVITFTEKPPVEMAAQFIASGEFFWNAGIFIWRLPILMEAYRQYLPTVADSFFNLSVSTASDVLHQVYSSCESISVDTGIMEKADNVHVMEASFDWSDIETWEALYESSKKDENNNAIVSGNVFTYDSKNCIVHIPHNKSVVLQGLDGYIVTGNTNLVMICKRDQAHRTLKFASDVDLRYINNHKNKKKKK